MARYDRVIPPGEEGTISASVETDKYEGPVSKALKVRLNDPAHAMANLEMKATIKSWIDVLPAWSASFQADLGAPMSQTLLLKARDKEKPLELIGATSDNQHVDVAYQRIPDGDPDRARGDYRVILTVDDKAPIGPLTGMVNLSTTMQEQRRVRIPIVGQVLGPIRFFPVRLVMFADSSGRPPRLSGTVVLQSRPSSEPFEITGFEASDERMKLEPMSEGKENTHRVAATWTAESEKGLFEGTIHIHTSNPVMPEIEVPWQVRID